MTNLVNGYIMVESCRIAIAIGVLWASSLFAAGPVGGPATERIKAISKAVPTAVLVFEPGGSGGGSGVLISPDGYALTNFHVTSPAGSFMRCGLADGKIYDAVIVGVDPVGDLAMIRLLGEGPFPYSKLADSDQVRVGDPCFAAGNPFLLATNLEPSVSWGIVSGTHRYQFPSGTLLEYADCLQTDAAINPGNSGGALFDASGDVIGIVGRCSFEKRGRINVGIGYAISSRQAANFVGVLRSGRIIDHATLGLTVTNSDGRRVRISNILDTSDAYRRGLRYGDEIVSIDGREIRTANDLTNILGTLPEGWRVPIVYRKEGQELRTIVRLPGIHAPGELQKKMAGALPSADEPKKKGPEKDKSPPDRKPKEDPEEPKSDPKEDDDDPTSGFDPRIVAMFEERSDLANDYFNRVGRERMLESLRKTLPVGLKADKGWKLQGKAKDINGDPMVVDIELRADSAHVVVGDQFDSQAPLNKLYEGINDRTLSGLQAALMVWEQLARNGFKGTVDATYYGTCPLRGERVFHDSMIFNVGELECRLYTEIDSGRVAALEVQANPDMDPVELYPEWDAANPSSLKSLELVYGTEATTRIEIEKLSALEN